MKRLLIIIAAALLFTAAACSSFMAAEQPIFASIDQLVAGGQITMEQAAQLKVIVHEVLTGLGSQGIDWGALLGGLGTLVGGVFGISFLRRDRTSAQLANLGLTEEALKKVAAMAAKT